MAQVVEETLLNPTQITEIEGVALSGIGKMDIDDFIEYVHQGFKKRNYSHLDLYEKYVRQRWNVYDLDFTQDRIDWVEKMTEEERDTFLRVASGFHHGERQVEVDLVPLMMGGNDDAKIFLTSQLEDEARHTVFFDRFYREVVGLTGETILDVLDGSYQWITETFLGPFGLLAYVADDLRKDPEDPRRRMRFVTLYHLWIEGVLALAVMKITLSYARQRGFLPAYYAGFTATCRDESRHVQFGMGYMLQELERDPSLVDEIQETLRTILGMSGAISRLVIFEPLGWTLEGVRAVIRGQLDRKLRIIGLELPADVREMADSMQPVLAGG